MEAVFDPSFVHQEAIEGFFVVEVLYECSGDFEVGFQGGWAVGVGGADERFDEGLGGDFNCIRSGHRVEEPVAGGGRSQVFLGDRPQNAEN